MVNGNKTPFALGMAGEVRLRVESKHTADDMGNSGASVLATPVMIGLMEQASLRALAPALPDGSMTVGVAVHAKHLAATPPGREVVVRATTRFFDGRRIIFTVEAHDEAGLIGEGTHERVWVQSDRFLANVEQRFRGEARGR